MSNVTLIFVQITPSNQTRVFQRVWCEGVLPLLQSVYSTAPADMTGTSWNYEERRTFNSVWRSFVYFGELKCLNRLLVCLFIIRCANNWWKSADGSFPTLRVPFVASLYSFLETFYCFSMSWGYYSKIWPVPIYCCKVIHQTPIHTYIIVQLSGAVEYTDSISPKGQDHLPKTNVLDMTLNNLMVRFL